MLNYSFEELVAFQRALKEFVSAADHNYSKEVDDLFIALEGRYFAFILNTFKPIYVFPSLISL